MSEGAPGLPRRTDPRTYIVQSLASLGRLAIPLALGVLAMLSDTSAGSRMAMVVPILLAVLLANAAAAYLRWTRLIYEVREHEIRVESGLLSRTARSVPYERIQDVSLEQRFLARLFGLTEVKFETGAGGGEDLRLAYLAEGEGERLRELVRSLRDGAGAGAGADIAPADKASAAETLFAMTPRRIVTFGLFEFSLAAVAALFGAAQQFDFLLRFDWWDVRRWYQILSGPGHWLGELGLVAQALGLVLAVGSLLLVGTATGIVRTVLREWDFRLERSDKGLRRRRGLLTRTDVVMPLHRVQALRIGTGFLRRRFGWHGLQVVSLASDSGSANHDAVPFGQMAEIAPVVAQTAFALPAHDLEWHHAAAAYRWDRAMLGAGTLGIVALANLAFGQWPVALATGLIGFVGLPMHEYLRWKSDRHALDPRQLYARHGWLAPNMTIASRVRLQSVEIARGPLARLRGYADLHLGLAGGRLRMRGLPLPQALQLRAAVLASIARTDFSELTQF